MDNNQPDRMSRREAMVAGAAVTAGGWLLGAIRPGYAADVPGMKGPRKESAADTGQQHAEQAPQPPGMPGVDYNPVVVPNGYKVPWKVVDGVKVFHMVAEELWHEFVPPGEGYDGLRCKVWGYNGVCHGPAIEAVEGDRIRIYVTNRLNAPTSVHWHGILLPNGMDGVGGLNQQAIPPGETFVYEFTLHQHGTGMYHSHHDEMTQIGLGMTGLFIIHPRGVPREKWPDRDFALLLHEWRIDPGSIRPNPNEMMEFNILTMNAKAFPATEPLVAKKGDRVRIRIGNLSPMDHHPIHLHGYQFLITETDGGPIPESAQWPETTVLVPVGSTRTVEFVADEPGDWAMHCHMTHHVMNQMGHQFPNMIGFEPGDLDRKIRGQQPTGDGSSRPLLPAYMTMGQSGMADMAEMGMKFPPNSVPMIGGPGKHDYITMGGMFTILKVRDGLTSYADPGWYENPPRTLAVAAAADDLRRDGIEVAANPGIEPAGIASPTGLRRFDPNARPSLYAVTAPAVPPVAFEDVDPGVTTPGTGGAPVHEAHQAHGNAGPADARPAASQPARAGQRWTCTMHPEVVSDKPGKCPKCGMKLVPKK
jgi:hypothetical protein